MCNGIISTFGTGALWGLLLAPDHKAESARRSRQNQPWCNRCSNYESPLHRRSLTSDIHQRASKVSRSPSVPLCLCGFNIRVHPALSVVKKFWALRSLCFLLFSAVSDQRSLAKISGFILCCLLRFLFRVPSACSACSAVNQFWILCGPENLMREQLSAFRHLLSTIVALTHIPLPMPYSAEYEKTHEHSNVRTNRLSGGLPKPCSPPLRSPLHPRPAIAALRHKPSSLI